jgi:23S rRNA pseudouridine2457 synthase
VKNSGWLWNKGYTLAWRVCLTARQPCTVKILQEPLPIPHRLPHMIKHQKKPYTWLSIVLKEGKNRQIRRMTSAVGFPTVRLVRVRINTLWLNDMQAGRYPADSTPVVNLKSTIFAPLLAP